MPKPSLVFVFNVLPSNFLSRCTAYSLTGSTTYRTPKPFSRRLFQERRGANRGEDFNCDVPNVELPLLYAIHKLLHADLLIAELGGAPNSLNRCTAYSPTGPTMYRTSKPLLRRFSQERRGRNRGEDFTGDVANVALSFLHAIHILRRAASCAPHTPSG